MKLHYYPETDSLYIEFSERPSVDSYEVVDGVVLDVDEIGQLVGLDIDHASKFINLSQLEAVALPVMTFGGAKPSPTLPPTTPWLNVPPPIKQPNLQYARQEA